MGRCFVCAVAHACTSTSIDVHASAFRPRVTPIIPTQARARLVTVIADPPRVPVPPFDEPNTRTAGVPTLSPERLKPCAPNAPPRPPNAISRSDFDSANHHARAVNPKSDKVNNYVCRNSCADFVVETQSCRQCFCDRLMITHSFRVGLSAPATCTASSSWTPTTVARFLLCIFPHKGG